MSPGVLRKRLKIEMCSKPELKSAGPRVRLAQFCFLPASTSECIGKTSKGADRRDKSHLPAELSQRLALFSSALSPCWGCRLGELQ